MEKLSTLALLIIFALNLSCSKMEDSSENFDGFIISENDFGASKYIEAEIISGISEFIISPYYLSVSDSLLLIIDRDFEKKFHFFSLKTFEYLGWFGKQGEGPGEISSAIPFMLHHDLENNGEFSFFDFARTTVSEYSFPEVLEDSDPKPERYYTLPPELLMAGRVSFLNDSTIVGQGGLTEGKLFFFNTKNESVYYTNFIPKLKNNKEHERRKGNFYLGKFVFDSQKKRVAVISDLFKQIEIYNTKGDLIAITKFEEMPEEYDPDILSNKETSTLYYYDIDATFDLIYLLYLGKSDYELEQIEYRHEAEIHVYDWEGRPVRKYKLDRYIEKFSVDSVNNRIFAVDPNAQEHSIVYFELE